MESMTLYAASLVDRDKHADVRLEAAMCKLWATERSWEHVDETMQIRGGRGYETAHSLAARGEEPVPIERLLRDSRINTIFEGSSEIMRLFIAREALDPHLKIGAPMLDTRRPLGERARAGGESRGVLRDAGIRGNGSARSPISASAATCIPRCAGMCAGRQAPRAGSRARSSTPWRASGRSSNASRCCSAASSISAPNSSPSPLRVRAPRASDAGSARNSPTTSAASPRLRIEQAFRSSTHTIPIRAGLAKPNGHSPGDFDGWRTILSAEGRSAARRIAHPFETVRSLNKRAATPRLGMLDVAANRLKTTAPERRQAPDSSPVSSFGPKKHRHRGWCFGSRLPKTSSGSRNRCR